MSDAIAKQKRERKKMKKLVIIATVALAAVIGEAAQFSWSLNRNASSPYKSTTVYAIEGSDYSTVVALLTAGGADVATEFNKYVKGSAATGTNGAGGGMVEGITGTTAAFIVFDGAIADGSTYDTTGPLNVSAYLYSGTDPSPGTFTMAYTDFGTKAQPIGGSTPPTPPQPIPEPTSGLLLMLGVAGLALRRKGM